MLLEAPYRGLRFAKTGMLMIAGVFAICSCSVNASSASYSSNTSNVSGPYEHEATLNELVEDDNGNSFKITGVSLENEVLCFTGEFVFDHIDSRCFFVSGDGLTGIHDDIYDYEYYLSLDECNLRNSEMMTDYNLSFSGQRILCFQTDESFVSRFDEFYYPNGEDILIYAYFEVNTNILGTYCYTSFTIPLSQVEII